MGYLVIDRDGEPLHEEPFATERKAIEAKRVYEDHVEDAPRPFRVVKAEGYVSPKTRALAEDTFARIERSTH